MSKYYNEFYKGSPSQFQIDLLEILLKDEENPNVLEIGSGNGFLLNYMKDNNIKCGGVEILDYLYDNSKKQSFEMYKSVFDVEYKKFNCIYMNNVIEHMKLEEIYYVLKNFNGKIIISTPDIRMEGVAFKLPQRNRQSFWDDYQHIKPYTPTALQRLLNDFSFEIIELQRVKNKYGNKYKDFIIESYYKWLEFFTGIKHPFYIKAKSV